MSATYSRNHVKISVAKILQTLGWHTINSTPLEILTDILTNYLAQLAKLSNDYANEFGYTEPSLDHLGLAFRELGVNLPDLEEYVRYVNFGPGPSPVPKYPVSKEDHLNFLKPGSKEVVTRPVHIHEHLPPMHPLLEGNDSESENVTIKQEEASEIILENNQVFKRPADIITPTEFKRPKREEEGSRPTREISSVMMTTSGFLSPAREGKLPESRTPIPPPVEVAPPAPPPTVETPLEVVTTKRIPKVMKRVEKKKDKLGKELFKPMMDEKVRKPMLMKEAARGKQMKAAAHLNNLPNNLPIGTDFKLTSPHHQKINPTKINKTLAAARLKTEKLNTTITPIPMRNFVPNPLVKENVDKLFTEPDKKKINILKKISNVKNENKMDNKKKDDLKQEPESPPNLIIDEPDEIVNKITNLPSDITIEPINPVRSPKIESTGYFDDDSPPGTPSTPKTPEIIAQSPPLAKEKRKRKDKARVRKLQKHLSPQGMYPDVDLVMERPKTPEAPHIKQEMPFVNSQVPPLTHNPLQFLANFGGPGLIPPPIGNPLFPTLPFPSPMNIPNFGQNPYMAPTLPPIHNPLAMANFLYPPKVEPPPPSIPPPIELDAPEKIHTPNIPEANVKIEKKPKEHKKEKKDKIKKKNKKDKEKAKAEKKKLKEEKKEKIKKEKKDKRKDKDIKDEVAVPKLTLKLSSPSSRPSTPDTTKKLNIKPVVKKEEESAPNTEERNREMSPSLAKISALVTGPPKHKTTPTPPPPPVAAPAAFNDTFPTNPSTNTKKKIKPIPKIRTKEIKKEPVVEQSPALVSKYIFITAEDLVREEVRTPVPAKTGPGPGRPRIHPIKPKVVKPKKRRSPVKKLPNPQLENRTNSHSIKDADGKEVWICPACGRQDDGSPMIGCDGCDAWYHWVCVGIQVPPDDNEDWYCRHCLMKKDEDLQSEKKKKRKRKEKKEH